MPDVVTVIDCVVEPSDHVLPVASEDVSTTLSPSQNVKGPLEEIVGTTGTGFTMIVSEAEAPEVHPDETTSTLNVPEVVTVIDCVVAPFDQRLSVADDEVSVTDPPLQKVVAPLAVIVGTEGTGFTVTLTVADGTEEQAPKVE